MASPIKPTAQQTEMLRLLDELKGRKCRCHRRKAAGQTFCGGCYFELPEQMRKDLYKRLGSGYEEAYRVAVEYLEAHPRKEARHA